MKTAIATILGYAIWTLVWLGGNAGFRALGLTPQEPSVRIEQTGTLLALLLLSVVASLAAGFLSGLVSSLQTSAYLCAGLLLATGLGVQWGARALFPVWYHAAFLILLVPLFFLGRRFVGSGS